MRTIINKKSDFDFIVLDNEGNAVDMPSNDFTLDLWTWGSKCRFRASSIGGVLKGCKNDGGKLRVYVDNPGFVPGKLVGEWITYAASEDYADGSQRTCRYISDFGIDMVDGDSTTNEQQVLAMMQYIQGASAYEIACEHGYQGTEEEWLNSLSLESVNAANECRELMAQLSAAEDVRNANEQTRIANEQARVESESSRSFEESNRVDAESTRIHNESARHNREKIRQDAENYRITHENSRESNETMRQNSETARVAAEESRVAAEKSRQAAEQARETAEVSRAAAEEERKRTHNRLKAAMREYADAESLREEAEAERREAEQYRIEYEQSRQSAEADRLTNERNRATAESQRITNETARSNAESNRAASETARQEAETSRQEAEQGRVAAEQQREDAEAARVEEFATFEGKITAKEDAANKVTSIGADANNTTFPTTRAVLNSIAEVKNIEVTPEMLSESTKQYINASGGGTITNLADDEDLTSVDNVLKLADKDYSPTSYSGMGRVYLRKNMVDGKNILTQEMLTKENTIYIIQYDYDLNGATINVPANCTLDFQGGSLRNGEINLNSNQIIGERCLRCKISNPKNNTINIGVFDLDYFSPESKVELINDLCSKCNLNIDVDSIELNDSVVVSGNISIIGLNRNAIYRPKIIFNNSAGFVYTGIHNQNSTIKDIDIKSEGTCIQFTGGVYQFYFENLNLKSNNGNCVEASNSFNIRFIKVMVSAPNGAGFRGFIGNTTSWHNCGSDSCFTVFQNSRGYIENFNGTWGTSAHFMCDDDSIPVGYGRISTIVNSNIESFKESPFVLKGNSDNLCFIKSSVYVYKSAEDEKYHYPVIDAKGLDGLQLIDSSLNTSPIDYIDGVYPIMSDLIGNKLSKNYYSSGSLYFRDKNILLENINTGQHTLGIKYGGRDKYALFNSVDMAQNKLLPYSCRILRTEIVVPDNDAAIELSDLIDSYVLNTQEDVVKSVYIKLTSLFDGGLMRVAPFEISFLNNTSNVTFDIGLYGKKLQLLPGQKGSYKIDGWRSGLYDVSSLNLIPRYKIFEAKALPTITNSAPTTQGLYGYFKGCNTVVIFDGSKWRFTNGACANNVTSLIGTSSVRNGMTLTADNVGFQFFDTTLNKPIWWTGSAWVDATGQEV